LGIAIRCLQKEEIFLERGNNMNEQNEMILNWKDKLTKIGNLKRSTVPMIAKVKIDKYTDKAQDSFDYDFDGSVEFYPFLLNQGFKNLDFNILVITGASGSGKSTFSNYFGTEQVIDWDNSKSVISNFTDVSPDEAVERLVSVGLNSIPTWTKPRNVLSVGEGFRADLARKIKSNAVIDEFTSTVDRDVALSTSRSISKYIKMKGLKKVVIVSCHKDFIDILEPDYVVDLDDEAIYDTRGAHRSKFEIQIFQTKSKREIWKLFREHHYLSHDLNIAANIYTAYWKDRLVAMCAILPQPGVADGQAWRIHRIVVLPDFQGLGVGTRFMNMLGDLYNHHGKILYIRTSHTKLIHYLMRNEKWYGDGKLKKSNPEGGQLASKNKSMSLTRKSASFKYVQDCLNDDLIDYNSIRFLKKIEEPEVELFTLF